MKRTILVTKIEVIEVALNTVLQDGGTLDNLECNTTDSVHNVMFARVMAGVHDAAIAVGADPKLFIPEGDETIMHIEYTS